MKEYFELTASSPKEFRGVFADYLYDLGKDAESEATRLGMCESETRSGRGDGLGRGELFVSCALDGNSDGSGGGRGRGNGSGNNIHPMTFAELGNGVGIGDCYAN